MNYIFKRLAAGTVILCFCAGNAFANNVNVSVNGKKLSDSSFIKDGVTYVPLREAAEALGASVAWNAATSEVNVTFRDASQVFNLVGESVVAIAGNYKQGVSFEASQYKDSTAHGTGVVIKSNGTILTNAHVVKDIENITVIFRNGESFPGTVTNIDELSDLAVVRINKLGLKPIVLASPGDVLWGETVLAVGTPLSLSMRNTVTKGIISGIDVPLTGAYYPMLQTDAAINAGNSGGPLVDMNGRLVGINSAKYSGLGVEGLAFAIGADTVSFVLNQFEKNGRVLRPDIGAVLEESWEAKRGLPTHKGLTVKSSQNTLLLPGDIITSVNGIEVHSIIEYNKTLRDTCSGGEITLECTRNGSRISLSVAPDFK